MRFETPLFVATLATVAAAAAPVVASAAPEVSAIETPLVAPVDPARIGTVAVGDGTTVWVERGAAGEPLALRTRDASGARTVVRLPYVAPHAGPELEVGRAADGSAVVAIAVRDEDRTTIDLVRLSDGSKVRLPSRLRGGSVRGVGIDRGWIYATRATGAFAKRKATLWRARITGLRVGRYARIRSAGRTEDWSRVVADRNRVAVLATRGVKRGGAFAEDSWLVGTPRGHQARVARNYATEGGYEPVLVAGFTEDRDAVITVQNTAYAPAPADVRRIPLGGGEQPRTVRVLAPIVTEAESIGFDGSSDRLVAAGPDRASGVFSLGTVSLPWDPVER